MPDNRLLLLSTSKNAGQGYLEHAEAEIKDFLGAQVRKVLFIPFAAVRYSFDQFVESVGERFQQMGYELTSVHMADDPVQAVQDAEAVVVGGGNTFHLLHSLYRHDLLEPIPARGHAGPPHIARGA